MEYPLITRKEDLVVGTRYFFVAVKNSEGKKTKYAGLPLPVGQEGYAPVRTGILAKKDFGDSSYFRPTTNLYFTDVKNNKGVDLTSYTPRKPFPVAFPTDYNIYSMSAVPVSSMYTAPTPNELATSLGTLKIVDTVPNSEPLGGAGGPAPMKTVVRVEVPVMTEVESTVVRTTPSTRSTNDLFLWAINGDFGVNTLKSILKRKNVNLNELLAAQISMGRLDYNSRFSISIPGLESSSPSLTKTASAPYGKFNRMCDLGPEFPADLFQVDCGQGILDLLILKYQYNEELLPYIDILLSAGADPNLGVITACYMRKPAALNALILAGAQPEKIIRKYTSPAGNFVSYPLLSATPCSIDPYIYFPARILDWHSSIMACVNLLLYGNPEGTGDGFVGEQVITDEMLSAIVRKYQKFKANDNLKKVISDIYDVVKKKKEEQVIEHLDPNTGKLAPAIFETLGKNLASPAEPAPRVGGFYRSHTRKNGKATRRRNKNRRRGTH